MTKLEREQAAEINELKATIEQLEHQLHFVHDFGSKAQHNYEVTMQKYIELSKAYNNLKN